MCTASWLRRDGALHFFFNRDEEHGREPAAPPALAATAGVRFLAPRDGRAGGTWVAVTAHGLVLALLNRSDGRRPAAAGSRGRLIPRLAAAAGPGELETALAREPLDDLAPFRLAALWLRPGGATAATWDGERLAWTPLPEDTGLLCSSGLGDERATRQRTAVWQAARARGAAWGPEQQRVFHRGHEPAPSAWSVCMHRAEAATLSYTEIELTAATAQLRHLGGAPCRGGRPTEHRLARSHPGQAGR